jgi:hypothetical protein
MTGADDWKGEHLIRKVPADPNEARRVVSNVWHERRRVAGDSVPAHDAHKEWARWAVFGQTRKPSSPVKP